MKLMEEIDSASSTTTSTGSEPLLLDVQLLAPRNVVWMYPVLGLHLSGAPS
jgi:hypothetical protein